MIRLVIGYSLSLRDLKLCLPRLWRLVLHPLSMLLSDQIFWTAAQFSV